MSRWVFGCNKHKTTISCTKLIECILSKCIFPHAGTFDWEARTIQFTMTMTAMWIDIEFQGQIEGDLPPDSTQLEACECRNSFHYNGYAIGSPPATRFHFIIQVVYYKLMSLLVSYLNFITAIFFNSPPSQVLTTTMHLPKVSSSKY